jgi:WD40 repeat protein
LLLLPIVLVLAGCAIAPPPPDTAEIIITITAEAQEEEGPVVIESVFVPDPTATPTPTVTPTPTPTATPTPLVPTDTPTPASLSLVPATATPAFPQEIITDMNVAQIARQRFIGYGAAQQAAMTPSGNKMIVGTTAGLVWVELPSLEPLRFEPTEGTLDRIVFSPGGTIMATAWNRMNAPETRLWWSADSKRLATVDGIDPVFSPDGQLVATTVEDGESGEFTTWLWSSTEGEKRVTLVGSMPHFSPDGEMVATVQDAGSDNPATLVWRVEDGALLRDLRGSWPAFSPDGRWLVTLRGQEVQLWSMGDEEEPTTRTQVIETEIREPAVSFNREGDEIRIVSNGLHVWELEEDRIVSHMNIPGTPGSSDELLVNFLSRGEGMLVGIQLIRMADGSIRYEDTNLPFSDQIFNNEERLVAYNPNHQRAALVTLNGLIRLVDLNTGEINDLHLPVYHSVAFNHDGQLLATASKGPTVDLWRTSTLEQQQHKSAPWGMSFNRLPLQVRFSHDGLRLAVEEDLQQYGAAISVAATLWSIQPGSSGNEVWNLTEIEGTGMNFDQRAWAYNPSITAAAWVNRNNQVELQRMNEHSMIVADRGPFTALEFSFDGSLLALAHQNGEIQLVRTAAGSLYDTVQAGGEVQMVGFSPDASLLGALRSDGVLAVWRVGEKQPIANLITGAIDRFLFTTNNQMVVTGSQEGVSFYRISDSRALHRLDVAAQDIAMEPVQWYLAVLEEGRVSLWGIPRE